MKADQLNVRAGKKKRGYTLNEQVPGRIAARLPLGSGTTWCSLTRHAAQGLARRCVAVVKWRRETRPMDAATWLAQPPMQRLLDAPRGGAPPVNPHGGYSGLLMPRAPVQHTPGAQPRGF